MNGEPESLTSVITGWARRCPEKTAVKSEEPAVSLSYLELEQLSNRIANFLYGKITGAPHVAIILDRSPLLIASVIGVLKCGLVFVPINPSLPPNRIKTMVEQTRAQWVITDKKYDERFNDLLQWQRVDGGSATGGTGLKTLLIDIAAHEVEPAPHRFCLETGPGNETLAFDPVFNKDCYILFTSGSTGVPKGVMGRQRGLLHFLQWEIKAFGVDDHFNVSQLTTPSFDPFLRDVFIPLLAGGTCCIPSPDTVMNMRRLIRWIDEYEIGLIHMVPSLFKELTSEVESDHCFSHLQVILLAGELLRGRDIAPFIRRFKQRIQLVNGYGPTETTQSKCLYFIQPGDENRTIIPVGKPMEGAQVLILDSLMQKCPPGKRGEVYIRTPFRSAGYYNDPALTGRVFLKNPFGHHPHDLLYKSGDLGRELPDANIEIFGRIDFQVKIRGFRIEVGEIENRLLAHPGIRDAVVTAVGEESAEKYLCAYVVPASATPTAAADLKKDLARHLPDYMIPSAFVQLERLPLTPTGKIDRGALPEPVLEAGTEYVAPTNDVERKLVKIWSDLLRLEENKIGTRSNFFELGGHSLRAAILTSRIHKEFNVNIPLVEVFNILTIQGLSGYIRGANKEELLALEPAEERRYYPLSSVQERLYFLQLMEESSTGYNMPRAMQLRGTLARQRFEEVFRQLIRRHEGLRTCFVMEGDNPVQVVLGPGAVEFQIEFLTAEDRGGVEGGHESPLRDFVRPFDLSRAPLLRVRLLELPPKYPHREENWLFMVDMHHIIADGTSLGVLIGDFMAFYEGRELPGLRIHYKDYSQWERRSQELIAAQAEFWLREFDREIPVLELPLDFERPRVQSFAGNTLTFELDGEVVRELRTLALKEGTTLYMVLMTAYNTLLWKLSGQETLAVGTPTAGRRHADLEQVIGMFVNTLALKSYPQGEKTFRQFLAEVRRKTLKAFANQDYQYDALVEKVMAYRDPSRNPLFDTMFVLQNVDIPFVESSGLTLEPYPYERNTAKFDLTLICLESAAQLPCLFEYCTCLFKAETIRRFMLYFENILAAVRANPGIPLADIDILSGEEKRQLVLDFNDTAEAFPTGKTIYRLFEEQVDRYPDQVVLVGPTLQITKGLGVGHLSYREMDQRANRLAHYLRQETGVGIGHRIVVLLERSVELIIALMGVMKAGAAYVPLDPRQPLERLRVVCRDASVGVVISQEKYGEKSQPLVQPHELGFCVLVRMDEEWPEIHEQPFHRPGITGVGNPAYVMYTSGSSGAPKGVVVEHRTIVNTLIWRKNFYGYHPGDVSLQNPPYFFDSSVTDIFTPMLGGARLVIITEEERMDSRLLGKIIRNQRVSHLILIPAFYNVLLEEIAPDLSAVRMITAAGEYFPDGLIKKHFTRLPRVRIFNEYGPTENSVNTTAYELKPGSPRAFIGKPISNVAVYILDRYLCLCPVGIGGEMCLAGASLARGYLNNPELTCEKFNKKFLPGGPGGAVFSKSAPPGRRRQKIYKTGDLGRWLADGNLEFLGRVDTQVKIRGIRVEMGEIENLLLRHGDIKEVVVLDWDDPGGEKYLCAYVVYAGTLDKEAAERAKLSLKAYLGEKLPQYMIPRNIIAIARVPLTPSGKIDRKALPVPAEDRGDHYTAPRGAGETKLVEIWGKMLGKTDQPVGIDDNFFAIGGDSIKAIQIVSRLNHAGYKTDMRALFQYPTIRELAPRLELVKTVVPQGPVTGRVPLTPIQEWFFRHDFVYPYHFNHAVMFSAPGRIAPGLVRAVFAKMQEHHDALRMTYQREPVGESGEIGILQTGHGPDYPLSLAEYDLREGKAGETPAALETLVNRIQAGIDLEKGPLLKLGLFHLEDGDRLLIVIHHLVIDGISWRILFEDLDRLMGLYKREAPLRLPLKTDSFKSWAERLRQYAHSEELLKEKAYWQQMANQSVPVIPKDFSQEDSVLKDTAEVSFELGAGETGQLLTRVHQAFGTEINDILLTALGLAMKKTWGHDAFLLSLEGHGREDLFAEIDISRTLGWFTSEYPVLLDLSFAHDPGRQVKEIKETLRKIPHKGIGYGILKYLTPLDSKNDRAFAIKPQLSFNYLGQLEAEPKQTGLALAAEPVGQMRNENEKRVYELDVNGLISQNRLTMSIVYSRKQYKAETIDALSAHFRDELLGVIAFCVSKEAREYTPADFTCPSLCPSLEILERLNRQYPGTITDLYRLTPMQQGMLFHSVYEQASGTYFEQTSYCLQGGLEVKVVEESLNELCQRHDILRTAFVYQGVETPFQVILKDRRAEFYYEDPRGIIDSSETREQWLEDFKDKDRARGFEPGSAALMRAAVIRTGAEEYEIIWSFHHILMDGWCIGILNREFFEIYVARLEGREPQLAPLTPYKSYIRWLAKQDREASRAYWQQYLDSYEEAVLIPGRKAPQEPFDYKNETLQLDFDREKTLALNALAGKNHVTLNIVMQTLWALLLGKYNGKEDVVFGSVVSGRPAELPGVESMVGLFINTIPVRVRFMEHTRFTDLLAQVQAEALASEPHHYHPLAEIQSQSLLKKDLLSHIFIFENYPMVEQIKGYEDRHQERQPFEVSHVEVFEQTNYDFNVIAAGGERAMIKFNFNANVFDSGWVGRMVDHFRLLVEQVLGHEEIEIGDLTLLSNQEKQQILDEFNKAAGWFPRDKTLQQLFAEQVERTPDQAALVGPALGTGRNAHCIITDRKLDEIADHAAYELLEKGVAPDTIVGIMLGRSLEMIIGILGILKAGAAYMPMDPDYPAERIEFMLKDSSAKILVSERNERGRDDWHVPGLDLVDAVHQGLWNQKAGIENQRTDNGHRSIPRQFPETSAAYIIYTSGTTGMPKGTMLTQRNVIQLMASEPSRFDFHARDAWTLFHSFCFDFSVWEMYGALLFGGKSVLVDKTTTRDPAAFLKLLKREQVTVLNQTPSAFYGLSHQEMKAPGRELNVRWVIFGGEALKPARLKEWREKYPGTRLINMFGITETTVHVTFKEISRIEIQSGISNIGTALAPLRVYVMDKGMKPVPAGVPGECVVGGPGVARGYINRPQLTREKFIANPFNPGEILYRSGDLVRRGPDGELEYLGRIDHQVKIRGFRIELGEIENRVKRHPGVKEAIVINRNARGREYLCAYVVINSEPGHAGPSPPELKEYLEGKLPDYMIPACFVEIEQVPLSSNGKTDRRQLPQPLESDFHSGETHVPPTTDLQRKITETWQEVLGREKVGINDNFFDLGGNSLDFIKISFKLKEKLDREISVITLLTYPTIRSLERHLTQQHGEETEDPGLIDEAKDLMQLTLNKLDNGD